ncbi:hypothetical protein [Polaromonas sp. CG9_12]|nr:hypothetical protein [Polaromonas sp. CG9_12]
MKNPKTRNFQTGSVSMVGEITERMLHYLVTRADGYAEREAGYSVSS